MVYFYYTIMNSFAPVYITFKNPNYNNGDEQKLFCDEILHNMKACLHRCENNRQIFNVSPFISTNMDINKCENIQDFRLSLEPTKTTLDIKTPILTPFSRYSVQYVVGKRTLVLKEFTD